MRFTKMHGLGNDYIYVNCFEETVENPSEVAKKVSDRHFGIGSDGLVLIMPSERADFKMRMFNSDGSEAEMCGNAIRCVGKYVFDRGMTNKNVIRVETLAGIKVLELTVQDGKAKLVKVDMGEPILKPENIPVNSDKEIFRTEPVEIDGKEFKVTCVSMGNPHAVSYVKNVDIFPLEKIGPKMEHHPLFPKRINAEFVEVIDRTTLKMRVWERGAGETLACGTGACAVLVASVLNGVSERKATVKLLGGDLIIEWNENNNHVYMTGPAVKVFEGEVDLNEL
ncbi:MAG TPA: diaminopimelate epimerase [Hungateiclostridium thermocellum]|uniref:Diaminopimelate epimerase n=2 Tax=Acetivibrio thermocellus TaxID=1515 RepID=DAPF_ACET2|nr:diaminopimelate epimerase [Acetivibrio thermocellus]A3DK16.1 RecName: Full=Diaminopimelate epimerase; Short=DAP epimerase; AltName: Full=PLP-independent amino acid racemase [Acetivibrio thermocellus ATCC 27405]CDG37579.1 Diaminopimelate epimerase [Acetivibrio thermocellus BC1]ABN54295.1 diaminopimelate epimerase [Acetivibrio thermocellus ATCC 27405]ADU73731.1 diaminopimelate epimerase [Acetivibrio thermocellus DSM 1313]ALX07661.1 Diaminopimelate epimerase [Acetivibrio thermocellus AD2]ANV7